MVVVVVLVVVVVGSSVVVVVVVLVVVVVVVSTGPITPIDWPPPLPCAISAAAWDIMNCS